MRPSSRRLAITSHSRRASAGFVCALAALALPASPVHAQQVESRPAIAISRVSVVDVQAGVLHPDMTIVIARGEITQLGSSASTRIPRGARVIDGRGRFAIPGLWDMHVHQALPFGEGVKLAANAEYFHPLLLANGVTTVRDMGGDLATLVRWKREIAAGTRLGPRQIITGQKLGARPVVPGAPFPLLTDADVRRSVRMLKEHGADFVKVDDLTPELLRAVSDESRQLGIPFAGHVSIDTPVAMVSDAGQRSVEHLDGVLLASSSDEAEIREILQRERAPTTLHKILRKLGVRAPIDHPQSLPLATVDEKRATELSTRFVRNDTWHVPTLRMLGVIGGSGSALVRLGPEAYRISESSQASGGYARAPLPATAPQLRAFTREMSMTGSMARAGVKMLAGTDAPSLYAIPGFSLHDELGLLVAAGLTPAQALASATSAPAQFSGMSATLGRVAVGHRADLVLLDADPLADIANTRRISAVFTAGRLLERSALDSLLSTSAAFVRRHRGTPPAGTR